MKASESTGSAILIVDDTPANLDVIVDVLSAFNHRVIIARDGEEGIQRAAFEQPDLILLDLMTPAMDGFEVCRQLKKHERTKHIPVILMTAVAETDDKAAGFSAGAIDYVTKPLQIDEVAARVNTHLRVSALQKQLEERTAQLHRYGEKLEQLVAERTTELMEANRRLHAEIADRRQEFRQQAFFDDLTGLPNRLLLSERMRQAMAAAGKGTPRFSLMMLDLDNFKEVNDILGHGFGDQLLRDIACRLQALIHAGDSIARVGEDEFALLLTAPDDERGAAAMAGKIMNALATPFMLDGREFVVMVSIGISRYPDDGVEIDGLYKYADAAMYHAKKLGRNTFHFYTRDLTRQTAERIELEGDLRKAQKNGELELYYQPQINMHTGCLVGAEALLRWNRPGHGLTTPDRFVPAAESTGLIVGIGEWVLTTACRAAVEWNRARTRPIRVSVNLSTRQFVRNDLAGTISRILDETGCKPDWLKLEITESLLLEDSLSVTSALQALDRMGLSIAIDDFGTGYSAMGYLNRFPVRQLKIDRSFVSGIPAMREKCELVKAMLAITSALRLEAVAEGVETQAQADYLMAFGCLLAQGYLFGRPMPQSEFETMMRQEKDVAGPVCGAL